MSATNALVKDAFAELVPLLSSAKRDMMQQSLRDLALNSPRPAIKPGQSLLEGPSTFSIDALQGKAESSTSEGEFKPVETERKAKSLHPSQIIDNERKAVLRERIHSLEEEKKNLEARLRFEGVMKQENSKLQAELDRLRAFEQSFAALETEVLCAKRMEKSAQDKKAVCEEELKSLRETSEEEKRNLMYRLEESETCRVNEKADLVSRFEQTEQESRGLQEANYTLHQENNELRETLSQQARELQNTLENRDARLLRQKLEFALSEVAHVKETNTVLLSKNVDLQKGANTYGPKIHDLKSQAATIQAKLDKQFAINKKLAIDVDNGIVHIQELQEQLRLSTSAENAQRNEARDHIALENRAMELMMTKLCDVLGRSMGHNWATIIVAFDLVQRDLNGQLAELINIDETDETVMKDLWTTQLRAQYTRMRGSPSESNNYCFI